MAMAPLRFITKESAVLSNNVDVYFPQFPEFLEMMKTKANEVDQGAELRYSTVYVQERSNYSVEDTQVTNLF